MKKKPNLFIVGEGTSGTTAIYHFLKEHPDIFMSNPKEPHYFCGDFHEESDAFHGTRLFYPIRTEKDYMKLFSAVQNERVIGEGSATYLSSATAARKIFNFNPEAKIIIHLREPVSYLFSYFSALAKRNYETKRSFEEALSMEDKRRKGADLPANVIHPSYLFYSSHVKYYDKVKRYFDCFERERIWINVFEDFIADNRRVYKETLRFLEVDDAFEADFNDGINAYATPRIGIVNMVMYNRFLRSATQKVLPPSIYWNAAKMADKIVNKHTVKVPVSAETREHLMERFKVEVEKISELTGIDLVGNWGY